jgi:hypothetical protein
MIHFKLEFCVAVALFASPSFSQPGEIHNSPSSYNNRLSIICTQPFLENYVVM